ncbi:hypothetical protein CH373_07890 [Leptospira perolatii]|uniref:Uncharacterized protein n=1 Tax=Leptospira perolatii TaxID=2023191 RepID=A0A2M9ZMY3_9LEPT|nr:tetratricopeptide repeat protein [Leptospira perolatii]PJZ68950.1 hypothetical protein CH360_13825 [Leptospira perolatii]PJZ73432.1 hypothetical protein CH373_07890 [Leptospira perolatii]
MNKFIQIALFLSISTATYADETVSALEKTFRNHTPESEIQLANKLTALGSLKQKVRDYETAIDYYNQSLEVHSKMGEKGSSTYALTLYLKSISEFRLGRSCQALESIKEVIQVYQKLGNLDSAIQAEEEGLRKYQEACTLSDEQSAVSLNGEKSLTSVPQK